MSEPTLRDRFHLIGIGGAGMSVVAELLASRGATVEGSDREDSAVLKHLRSVGVRVYVGHDASRVDPAAVVVVSTAIRESNPELAVARERGQRVIHRSQALALAASGVGFGGGADGVGILVRCRYAFLRRRVYTTVPAPAATAMKPATRVPSTPEAPVEARGLPVTGSQPSPS